MTLDKNKCPLCDSLRAAEFCRDNDRSYFRCGVCSLVFAEHGSLPTPGEEKQRYDQHRNSPSSPRYRQFLSRLATPLVKRLETTNKHGLDFGSGPGPTLSIMLEEMGFTMSLYDPFYAPDPSVLRKQYDFVTCTEAIEHFHRPAREWGLLTNLVKPGGWLAIMTKLTSGLDHFENWHYKRDPMHVSFFSRETFRYLAARDGLECEFIGDDVILLKKPAKPAVHERYD